VQSVSLFKEWLWDCLKKYDGNSKEILEFIDHVEAANKTLNRMPDNLRRELERLMFAYLSGYYSTKIN